MMFKNILVPIDGSDSAWSALRYARVLGEKFNSTITVIHVIPPLYGVQPLNDSALYGTYNIREVEAIGQRLLDTAKDKLSGYPNPIKTILDFGSPSNRILTIAHKDQYDTIIIGSRGLSGVGEFFLGSVSTNVVQHAMIPVVVVK